MTQDQKRLRILLVDDHKVFREGLAWYLREEPGIEVLAEAETGPEALKAARTLNPDVVIMDVNIPGMNGIEATRILTHELPQTKIVGLSMHDDADIGWAMQEAGATAYLTKECPVTELVRTILACGPPRDLPA